ncbi:arylamine N-acetyltransferase family protein [Kribbella sp. CA-293567]|uniref:arylamine N-acetyltransferase family protein n=1 Tax=Kribbella sp. CA-293567 TaxID=3002436 RepID=UPI0022DCF391|nr:arylamine N-acetyltransferase [Kribbella sp. CA-293567]WBQ04729.1 arylamine N-acetyltransferase [Kribbella sp. CA-293567]
MTWQTESLDLDAYLRRIDHPPVEATVDALHSLHAAHVRAIPFENVDVILGTHPGIGFDAIQRKLVGRQRGGYCYEHALLFAAALEAVGFEVERRVARVQPHRSGPRTHMLLLVRAEGQEFLADVGFGAGLLHPMPLKDGAVVDQAGWDHQLTVEAGVWTLSRRTPDGWVPQHASGDEPQRLIDFQVYHHYVATHPDSPFSSKLVVMRLSEGISRRLVGPELTTEYADGRVVTRNVSTDELPGVLRELDVVLDAEEIDRLELVLPPRPV